MSPAQSPAVISVQQAIVQLHAALSARGDGATGKWGIACSGGADSMVLAHVCVQILGVDKCHILHVDHGLAADSEQVANTISGWCSQTGVAFSQTRVALQPGAGIEARARDARYHALRQMAASNTLRWIATAHSASDQAETVLMRIIRGTGLHGLAAIAPIGDDIIRPLLSVSAQTLRQYATEMSLPVWQDPMNADLSLFRGRIRHQLLPALALENPSIERALCDLASEAAEFRSVETSWPAEPPLLDWIRSLSSIERSRWWQQALTKHGIPVTRQSYDALSQALRFDDSGSRQLNMEGGTMYCEYGVLRLVVHTAEAKPSDLQIVLEPPGDVHVRVCQPGDRMRPQRLKGQSRKLSDLFADAKIPVRLRHDARVIIAHDKTGAQQIVWCEYIGAAWQVSVEVQGGRT
jgi:tRNA(Ile)-lysidine synthase